ncbi:SIR2 family NAD-dependent protein deacylase [Haloactinospora alba]|nr:Sir2 family NAD-dependent protein deacetylase [Haloactinospora alba]
MATTSNYSAAAALLAEAGQITVLTGAGISTESGIPDFRGPQGVWTTDPAAAALFDLDTYLSDVDVRRRVWRMRREHSAWTAEPNAAHRAITEADREGRLRGLITQNIDGLHQAAGTDPQRVMEVHGTIHYVVCMSCGTRTPTPEVLARLDDESDPHCLACGGVQKADTISFGQRLDPEVLDAAAAATADCRAFVTIGTSLTVHPVAGLCDIALERDIPLIIVNADPTPYDAAAAATVRDPIGEAVPNLLREALAARN